MCKNSSAAPASVWFLIDFAKAGPNLALVL